MATVEAEKVQGILAAILRDARDSMDEITWDWDTDASREATALMHGAQFQTFAEAGILTRDAGLVLRLADGSEFQITIVQSGE